MLQVTYPKKELKILQIASLIRSYFITPCSQVLTDLVISFWKGLIPLVLLPFFLCLVEQRNVKYSIGLFRQSQF